jgi:hypothetical protein
MVKIVKKVGPGNIEYRDDAYWDEQMQRQEQEEHERAYKEKMERDERLMSKINKGLEPPKPKAPESYRLKHTDGSRYTFIPELDGKRVKIVYSSPRWSNIRLDWTEEARQFYLRLLKRGFVKF